MASGKTASNNLDLGGPIEAFPSVLPGIGSHHVSMLHYFSGIAQCFPRKCLGDHVNWLTVSKGILLSLVPFPKRIFVFPIDQVGVFDSDLKAIETSPKLTGTSWKSALPLQRGKIYVWQVTAVKGSQQVVAPVPPAPEAKFAIIEPRILNELLAVESAGLGEHFKLGRAYARAGLLDEAEEEFRLVPAANPNYSQAQRFLTDLKALRHP